MRGEAVTPAWARLLLRLHPAWFRARWGAEVEATLAHVLAESGVRGRLSALRAGLDLAGSVVRSRRAGPAPGLPPRRGSSGGARDARFALRSLLRQPLFTLATVATLAVGIGAATVVFSIVYGFLLRPLPYPDADRLVLVWSRNDARGWQRTDVSLPDARDWERRTGVFEGLAVIDRPTLTLTGHGEPERLAGYGVTHDIFDVLRVAPRLGRGFVPDDGRPGAAGVAVLTDGFWQRRFGGDPAVVGSVVNLNETPHTVIGVLPPSFRFFEMQPDVLVALREDPATMSRGDHGSIALARLAPGVSLERAQRAVADVAAALAREHPETNEGWGANVVRLRDDMVGEQGRAASVVLAGAIVFVLLMVCVNIANLLLARGSARRREMAVRAALGAGRPRLVRQLMTESALLALAGGALGVAGSFAGVRAIVAALPSQLAPAFEFAVDLPVLLFALLVSVLATIAFGLWPALRDSRASSAVLREEGRAGAGRGARRFGSVLVVAQMTLAVILLVGGVTLSRSVVGLHRQDLGYVTDGVLTFRISPPTQDYPDAEALHTLHTAVLEQLRALPGVVAAGAIHSLPLRGANNVGTYTLPGTEEDDGLPARFNWITPGYTETVRLRVRAGRTVTEEDRAGGAPVVLVNEMLSRQRFDGAAVGRTLRVSGDEYTIVGVVADAHDRAVSRPPEPSLYLPAAQHGARSRSYVMRVDGDPASFAPAVRRVLAGVDPDLPPYELQPFDVLLAERMMPFRLVAGLMVGFAAISLLLAAVGLYGVTAYGVGRRTHEIGLRLAVGAERRGVIRMLVGEGMRRAALGVAIGTVAAIPLAGATRAIAVGVDPGDPRVFALVAAVLLGVALLGSWLPARRAVRLDPMRALTAD